MSIKASTFASIITNPMNTHRFEVSIPSIAFCQIIESTSFPAQGQVREIDLWYQGEKIAYPGQPENGGTWGFRIPEADSGKIKEAFDKLAAKFYNQKTGIVTPQVWESIVITCKDLQDNAVFSGTLHGAWLQKRGDLSLSAAQADQAAKWDYTFVYNWFEDGSVKNTTSASAPL